MATIPTIQSVTTRDIMAHLRSGGNPAARVVLGCERYALGDIEQAVSAALRGLCSESGLVLTRDVVSRRIADRLPSSGVASAYHGSQAHVADVLADSALAVVERLTGTTATRALADMIGANA